MENNLNHLVERTKQRFEQNEEKAKEILKTVQKIIEENSPDDWRFTVSPSAKFIIAYLLKNLDFRLLGRSYRDFKDKGKEIIERLKAPSLSPEELRSLVAEYKELLFNPNCEIYHELKTIYTPEKDLSDEKEIFEKITSSLSHIIPIKSRRIALRPNAIVVNNEIWVRQGEYFDLSKETESNYEEGLLFERLSKECIDKSKVRIYTLNK